MPSFKNDFLNTVLHHVKFPLDKNLIYLELESHIIDKLEYYVEQGYDKSSAEQLAIKDMGDANEIGRALNRQHNSIVGWLWYVTTWMVILFTVWVAYTVGPFTLFSLFNKNPIREIPVNNIAYKISLNEKVKLDDTVFHFTNIVYEKNGDIDIIYKLYDTRLWGTGWSLGYIGEISDNLGNTYFTGSGYKSGGIITKGFIKIQDFSPEAEMLIISYDQFNRKFSLEIPLKEGDQNE